MKLQYITVKGCLSKYFIQSDDGVMYYLYQPSYSKGNGFFLLRKLNFYYSLIKVLMIADSKTQPRSV